MRIGTIVFVCSQSFNGRGIIAEIYKSAKAKASKKGVFANLSAGPVADAPFPQYVVVTSDGRKLNYNRDDVTLHGKVSPLCQPKDGGKAFIAQSGVKVRTK